MKKLLLPLALAAGLGSAHATVFNFDFLNGQMDGAQETPSPVVTSAIGLATSITYNDVSNELIVNVAYSGGLNGPTTAAHVHGSSPVGVGSGVIFGLTITGDQTSGTITGMSDQLSAQQVTDLFNELLYVNLHTTAHAGGEIRGQLVLVPVPEPEEYAALAGAGLVGFALWRRRSRA